VLRGHATTKVELHLLLPCRAFSATLPEARGWGAQLHRFAQLATLEHVEQTFRSAMLNRHLVS
jgi:hypothetical protein